VPEVWLVFSQNGLAEQDSQERINLRVIKNIVVVKALFLAENKSSKALIV